MNFSFKNILIPVDLTISTEVAVQKGIDLASENTVIHLLHVQHYGLPGIAGLAQTYLININELPDSSTIEIKLRELKKRIESSKQGIQVSTCIVMREFVQKAVEEKAGELKADLIIIGKNSHHSWFPFLNTITSSELAIKTGIVVLTVKPGSLNHKIRTIVVPISNEYTREKVEAISAICGKFKIKIHLVTFMTNENEPLDFSAASLLEVYEWLKTMNYPVEYAVLHGDNRAKEILKYAEKIDADLLLVEPKKETRIGILNKHISDVLPVSSKMQILTV